MRFPQYFLSLRPLAEGKGLIDFYDVYRADQEQLAIFQMQNVGYVGGCDGSWDATRTDRYLEDFARLGEFDDRMDAIYAVIAADQARLKELGR